jgi:hypothetical protein
MLRLRGGKAPEDSVLQELAHQSNVEPVALGLVSASQREALYLAGRLRA